MADIIPKLSDIPWGLVAGAVLFLVVVWARKRSVAERARPVDTADPRWAIALEKARSTVPAMRDLYAQPGIEVFVKYPLEASSKEVEHVWGQLEGISETHMSVGLETPLVTGKPLSRPPYKIALTDLEDWQVMLPDGRIRGGFTTQLMITMARENGAAPPAQISAMEGRFVDV